MRTYQALTWTAPSSQGIELLHAIRDDGAAEHCETLYDADFEKLLRQDGVETLLSHLVKKYEPIEVHRKGQPIDEVYEFARRRGE